ncbi:MAG: hypothetical protein HKN30_12085 [Sulfitobacter sp.]|nr:hypothetical protein [Sulfitobacter sp.]
MRALILTAILTVAACTELPPPPPPDVVGVTPAGARIYQFRVTSSNALGWTPISEEAIASRAGGICPGGYREVGRSGEATRRISGVFYVDIDVQIACV